MRWFIDLSLVFQPPPHNQNGEATSLGAPSNISITASKGDAASWWPNRHPPACKWSALSQQERGAGWCWPGAWQDWKVWANQAVCQNSVLPAAAPGHLFRGLFSSSLWRNWRTLSSWNKTVPESRSTYRRGCVLCCLMRGKLFLSSVKDDFQLNRPGGLNGKEFWHVLGGL